MASLNGIAMNLPPQLLRAVSVRNGGQIALVLGAGTSAEPPTRIPASQEAALEVHRRLVGDGILQEGDCQDPRDLSRVADAVYEKTGSQKDVITRLFDKEKLRLAKPNDGHLIAAALMAEGAISSIVTLNFDLALTNALTELTVDSICIIECPKDLTNERKLKNIYYLHRNVNERDEELWVLRTNALKDDWQNHWESIVATNILTIPVVVFVGLGTPVSVLIETVRLLKSKLNGSNVMYYQVDRQDRRNSKFFQALEIDDDRFIQGDWCDFMKKLSERLVEEQVHELKSAIDQLSSENRLQREDHQNLFCQIKELGLVGFGEVRAIWLLKDETYCPLKAEHEHLVCDLILAIAMIIRVSDARVEIVSDGTVKFWRGDRIVATYIIASGSGSSSKEGVLLKIRKRHFAGLIQQKSVRGVIVGGTSDNWDYELVTPPSICGIYSPDNIVYGPEQLEMFHIDGLRRDQKHVRRLVP